VVLVNSDSAPPELAGTHVLCIPASRIAAEQGSSFGNVVMVGAVAAALGEPTLDEVQEAAVELLGRKLSPESLREAVAEGYRCLS
jgi:Pyruvate/2-oxoacid:ferredoxin oxidoreductase gamma subunit